MAEPGGAIPATGATGGGIGRAARGGPARGGGTPVPAAPPAGAGRR
jgi:hypothetical protein